MLLFVNPFILLNIFLVVNCYDQLLVDQLRWDFLILEDELWNFVLDKGKDPSNDTIRDPGLFLLKRYHEFDQKIQQMPEDILYGLEVAQKTQSFLFLFSDLRVIHDLYEKFRRVQNSTLFRSQKEEYAYYLDQDVLISHVINDVLYDPKNNVNKTIHRILERTLAREDSVVSELFELLTDDDYNCKNSNQAPRQAFFNLYNGIALTELKGYILEQFSYMAQRLESRENYTQASIHTYNQFEKRFTDLWNRFPAIIKLFPTSLWMCDPKQHIKGETYDELTGLIQGHIENEVDMNRRGTCTANCQEYSMTKSYGCYDYKSDYCQKRKSCSGQILGCRFIESHMTACIAPRWSSRRYEFIKYDSGRTFGTESYCSKRSVNSWFRWFVHCSYCFCLCDAQGPSSDRYFNLRPVMADVFNNRVVTGLRIIKNNRIIHLQIQEGKLLPYGYIDNYTVRWVPVDNYKITDAGIENGEDFVTMDFAKRSLYLDVLEPTEENYVVTGVQFDFIDNKLRLKINVRGFDFKNGTLSKDSYYIYGIDRRQKINIDNADIPTLSPPSTPIWPVSNRYVEFTHSSIEKDAAQTTVPFFDTQPVTSYPAVPLRGIGIYYKGKMGYGGFVAPRINIYDFSKHIQIQFPKRSEREDSHEVAPLSS